MYIYIHNAVLMVVICVTKYIRIYIFISCCSARYTKDDDDSANDELKGDDGLENKDEGDTVDAGDDVKSKEIVSKDAASDLNKTDDDDVVKEKGAEVHKRGSKNQHFWETWRRYSEFELLRNFLQTVYPHVSLCTRLLY